MKKSIIFIFIILILSTCRTSKRIINNIDFYIEQAMLNLQESEHIIPVSFSLPFSKGFNFSQWFEVDNVHRIQFTHFIEQDFINVKNMGADVIRLPVRLNNMTAGEPDYILEPLFLRLLDTVVDWAEKHELYLIIDNHSVPAGGRTPDDFDRILIPVWSQMAEHYKDRNNFLIFEIFNEPHGIADEKWGEIQGRVIEAIRVHDKERLIVVGGNDFNSSAKLSAIPDYNDPNLIYTFHFYDPFVFTHQGHSQSTLMEYISGVPFPYDRRRMPLIHPRIVDTELGQWMKNYSRDAGAAWLLSIIDNAVSFANERDVPIFCGEFGVYMPGSNPVDRLIWYKFISEALDRRNIPRISWDYYGGFGIFNTYEKGDFYFDLNTDLLRVMGFNPPPQRAHDREPLISGFTIYDDFPAHGISTGFWGSERTDFSCYETDAKEGEFAIRWENPGLCDAFWFRFHGNSNFSELAANGYNLEFFVRCDKPVSFDVRFCMSGSDSSHAWRVHYTVDENIFVPDGRWHKITIPLDEMTEQGAWVNKTGSWLNPRGEFSWNNINTLEFSSEQRELFGYTIYFDLIKIK